MATRFKPLHPYSAYYLNLHIPGVIKKLQYRYRDESVVYAIRSRMNDMTYVGSTSQPGLRFHNHLVNGKQSNPMLQADIRKYGMNTFAVYILEVVVYPDDLNMEQRVTYLHSLEQTRMDLFPKSKLYNQIRSLSH